MRVPPVIIHFEGIFPNKNHPFWVYTHLWKSPYIYMYIEIYAYIYIMYITLTKFPSQPQPLVIKHSSIAKDKRHFLISPCPEAMARPFGGATGGGKKA